MKRVCCDPYCTRVKKHRLANCPGFDEPLLLGRLRVQSKASAGCVSRMDWVAAGLTTQGNPLMMNKLVLRARRPAVSQANPAARRAIIRLLPPRSMVGQLTLDQHIGVRIPGGQPNHQFVKLRSLSD